MSSELDEIISDFDLIEDWDERYRFLIELGRGLKPFPEAARTEDNRVKGCASQVWLLTDRDQDGLMHFRGDSDAHIVKGLVRLTLAIFDGKTPVDVLSTDAFAVYGQLGLAQHLTPQRSNGVRSMVERIRLDARRQLDLSAQPASH